MTKPYGIPQDVWDAVARIQDQTYFTNETEEQYQFDCMIIARALMAAKDEARQALPDEIDLYRFLKNNKLRRRGEIAKAIATIIRES